MSNINAVKLVIENIQLLEQANKLLNEEIQVKLFETVDKVVKEHVDSFGEWQGCYQFLEGKYIAFAPNNWKAKISNKFHQNFYARYSLDCESSEIECEDGSWLSTFLKNDIERVIFNFYPWYDNFKEKVNNKKWKEFSNEQNQLIPQIEQLGFKYNATNGSWYLVVDGIEPAVFIESYENDDLEDALTPITEALDTLKQAHRYFDQIVQAAITKFGRIDSEDAA